MREIIRNEGNILVDPEGRNMIDQDDFSWFFSCSSQFDCFQLKRTIGKRKFPLEVDNPIQEWIVDEGIDHHGVVFVRHADSDVLWHVLVH